MGLITQEVTIDISNPKIWKRYLSLGYDISLQDKIIRHADGRISRHLAYVPKGTTLKVKVSDLPIHSTALVDVECDICHKIKTTTYERFNQIYKDGILCCKKCYGFRIKGDKNPNWNPNMTDYDREVSRISNQDYLNFIRKIVLRDNRTCLFCGKHTRNIEVHHLNSWDTNPEQRLDPNNCVSLCSECHRNFHSIYGFGNNTKEQFNEWMNKIVNVCSEFDINITPARAVYCYEENKIYESAALLCASKGCKRDAAYNCLNHTANHFACMHVFWLDEYMNMSKEDVETYVKEHPVKLKILKDTRLVCLNNNMVFKNYITAAKWAGLKNGSNFNAYFKNHNKYCGHHPDTNENLQWMYLKDYINLYGNDNLICYKD